MAILGLIELYAKGFGEGLFVAGLVLTLLGVLLGYQRAVTVRGTVMAIALCVIGILLMAGGMVVYQWQ
jgi:hypothetical protein